MDKVSRSNTTKVPFVLQRSNSRVHKNNLYGYHHGNPQDRATYAAAATIHPDRTQKERYRSSHEKPSDVPVFSTMFPHQAVTRRAQTLDQQLKGRGGVKGRAQWLEANARSETMLEYDSNRAFKNLDDGNAQAGKKQNVGHAQAGKKQKGKQEGSGGRCVII